MTIETLAIEGALLVSTDRRDDNRGYFARAYCQRDFASAGLRMDFVQTSLSFNKVAGTFRGMHYNRDPFGENKLVRCIRGCIVDVILDLRKTSSTYLRHVLVELSGSNQNAVVVPDGCAHGYITMEDDTELLYMIDRLYDPSASRGVRWDDPAFDIELPREIAVAHPRDLSYPDFQTG